MRYNGIQLIIRMAVQKLQNPLFELFKDALILGALREDILYLSSLGRKKGRIWEHWSLSHFSGDWLGGGFIPLIYPGAPYKAQRYFDRAVSLWQSGDQAGAFMNLGRTSHLLIDMACPTHARRVPHFTDGYEWFIDGNYEKLKLLNFEIPKTISPQTLPKNTKVREIVRDMARFTQQFEPDRTNHHFGRFLKKIGLRKSLSRKDFEHQANQIIPEAAARLSAIYLNFLYTVQSPSEGASEC